MANTAVRYVYLADVAAKVAATGNRLPKSCRPMAKLLPIAAISGKFLKIIIDGGEAPIPEQPKPKKNLEIKNQDFRGI